MKTVTFQNDGIIDPVSIATFGVNAKTSDNPIGYFGTGLKYAIAVLLRDGCDIVIHAGKKKFTFGKQENTIRDQTFNVVTMNKKPLGFTTELGKGWELWQAFRELYCNAMDEEYGSVTDSELKSDRRKTTIVVSGMKFHDCYVNMGNVVLGSEPLYKMNSANIHPAESNYIFYKSIRIYDGFHRSLFTYNVNTNIDISEDRTAKYTFQMQRKIVGAILQLEDEELLEKILLAKPGYFEHEQLDYDDSGIEPSNEFLNVAERLRVHVDLNRSVWKVLRAKRRLPPLATAELTSIQEKMLARAVTFSKQIGYNVDVFPIVTSDQLKSGLMGMAQDKTIYISMDTFGYGTKYLAATLIEEYLHLHTGYDDMTRELQNHLFNDIVSLGEQVIGEPV